METKGALLRAALLLALPAGLAFGKGPAAPAAAGIVLSDPSGKAVLRIEKGGKTDKTEAVYQVFDGGGKPVGTLKVKDDRVKGRSPADEELFKIKRKDYGAEIEDGKGGRLFKVKRDGSGWKLKDGSDQTVMECRSSKSGFTLHDGGGRLLASVAGEGGVVSFQDDKNKPMFTAKGISRVDAAMWLGTGLLRMFDRAGLMVYFLELQR